MKKFSKITDFKTFTTIKESKTDETSKKYIKEQDEYPDENPDMDVPENEMMPETPGDMTRPETEAAPIAELIDADNIEFLENMEEKFTKDPNYLKSMEIFELMSTMDSINKLIDKYSSIKNSSEYTSMNPEEKTFFDHKYELAGKIESYLRDFSSSTLQMGNDDRLNMFTK